MTSPLPDAAQRNRLDRLLTSLRVVPEAGDVPLPDAVELPVKDRPILPAALAVGATHLLTGDVTHFGPYFGRPLRGLHILTPAQYLMRVRPGG